MENKPFFSANEVAARWDVHPATVLRLIHDGKLPSITVGGVYRIARETILAHEGKSQTPTSETAPEPIGAAH